MQIRLPNAAPSSESEGSLLRHFVGRQAQRERFQKLLAMPSGSALPLVVVHGATGSGKSLLGRRILTELNGALPDRIAPWFPCELRCPAVLLDLRQEALVHDPLCALQALRDSLEIECPRFDLAMAWRHRLQEQGGGPGLWRTEAEALAAEAVEELADYGPDELPSAQPARFATTRLAGLLRGTKLGEWLQSREGGDDFLVLRELPVSAFSYRLVLERLADDLHKNLPKRTSGACRLLVVLDAFERTNGREDAWVRELYECLAPFSLILVLGRERLDWAKHDSDWGKAKVCEQHPLSGLSADDAEHFLTLSGVDSDTLRGSLCALCQQGQTYDPQALGLCADMARTLSPKALSELPTTATPFAALLEHFLRALPHDDRGLIEQLALVPHFDREAVRACTMLASRWDWLQALSFLEPVELDWYTFSAPVQEVVRAQKTRKESEHETWERHWQGRSKRDTDRFAALAWYHAWCRKPEEALKLWKVLAERERSAEQRRGHAELLAWWELTGLERRKPTKTVEVEALSALGVEVGLSQLGAASQRRAIWCQKAALNAVDEKKSPQLWAAIQNHLGDAYTRLQDGDRNQNRARAVACYESALRIYTKLELPQQATTVRGRLGGAYLELAHGSRKENLTRAISCHQASLRIYTPEKFPQEWAAAQSDMGYAYTELPSGNRDANLAQARAYYEAASRIYTEESHPIEWAVLQERISVLEWLQGRKDEARLLLERALEIFQNHGDLERIEHAQNTLQLWEPTPTSPVHRPKPQVAIFLALMIPVAFALWGAIQFLLGRLHG